MLSLLRTFIPQNSFLRRWYSTTNALTARVVNGFPGKNIKIIGVTGTDGKTTTVEILSHILRKAGKKVLSISSAQIQLAEGKSSPGKRTTPSPWTIQKLLKQAGKDKYDVLILEVSSHALSQKRIWGIKFDAALLTNITPEHLDYYQDFTHYKEAKKLLFTQYLKETGVAVLNYDDESGRSWAKEFENDGTSVLTFSSDPESPTSCSIEELASTEEGIGFFLKTLPSKGASPLVQKKLGEGENSNSRLQKDIKQKVFLPLFGSFNAENASAAMLAATTCDVSLSDSGKYVANFPGVRGRMESIDMGQNFSVFIDFAVTPGALENLLKSVRTMVGVKKIHLVFGCTGGDHDHTKRPEMGKIAAELADHVIVTDDETYGENPEIIRKEILEGAKQMISEENFSEKIKEIGDRKIAIETALQSAAENDVVLITGMGHLHSRNMGEEMEWSDEQIIRNALKVPLLSTSFKIQTGIKGI